MKYGKNKHFQHAKHIEEGSGFSSSLESLGS